MSEHKEVFTHSEGTLEDITYWLNSLVGQRFSHGKVIRIVDWHYVQDRRYTDYSAIARVELEAAQE